MRKYVKLVLCLVTLCICASLCAGTDAQAKIKSGKWKKNISWTYDTKKKELVLTGSGAIAEAVSRDDKYPDFPKWELFAHKVKSVRVEGKITHTSPFLAGAGGFPNMTRLKLSNNLKVIESNSFWDARKLKKVKLPVGLQKIKSNAFESTGLQQVTIPGSIKRMGDGVFQGCDNLKKAIFAEGVKRTGTLTFLGCNNLKKVRLPQSLKVIERSCFLACGLEGITVPQNVEEIEMYVFSQVSVEKAKLKNVTIKSKKIKKWGKDIFRNAHKELVIYVPKSKKKQYEKALRSKGLPTYVKVVGKKSLD